MDSDGTRFDNDTIPDKKACLENNHTWVNSGMNFDHVGKAYLSLFEVAIFKGWTGILYDAGDSREVKLLENKKGEQQQRCMHLRWHSTSLSARCSFGSKVNIFSTFIALIQ